MEINWCCRVLQNVAWFVFNLWYKKNYWTMKNLNKIIISLTSTFLPQWIDVFVLLKIYFTTLHRILQKHWVQNKLNFRHNTLKLSDIEKYNFYNNFFMCPKWHGQSHHIVRSCHKKVFLKWFFPLYFWQQGDRCFAFSKGIYIFNCFY